MEPGLTKIMWKLINHQYSVIRVRLIVSTSESSFIGLKSDSVTQNHSIMCALCILAHLFLYSIPHSSNGTICLMCLKCESNFCWSNMVWDWISIALTKYILTQQVNDSHICLLGNCKNKSKKSPKQKKKLKTFHLDWWEREWAIASQMMMNAFRIYIWTFFCTGGKNKMQSNVNERSQCGHWQCKKMKNSVLQICSLFK